METFAGCSSLKKIPSSLSPWVEGTKENDYNTSLLNMYHTFKDCSSLQELPDYLTKDFPYLATVESMCEGCTSLTSLPENLFTDCLELQDLTNAFKNCTGLQHLPPLWETLKENQNLFGSSQFFHEGCFAGCTQADNYDKAVQNGWA